MLILVSPLLIAAQSSNLAAFSYEIARAKGTISTYGTHIFRDERLHRRVAVDGSSIETYCAVAQYRDSEGRVNERPVYWVLRVRPAPGFLSDYERGSWDMPPPNGQSDYEKLCADSNSIGDGELLRSTSSTSSGSTYDPLSDTTDNVSADWLIGNWVATDNCATHRDELFRADGMYEGSEGEGTWRLERDRLFLIVTRRNAADLGEEERFTYFEPPRVIVRQVTRIGIDGMSLSSGFRYLRC